MSWCEQNRRSPVTANLIAHLKLNIAMPFMRSFSRWSLSVKISRHG
ncbi:MAG TPA: hypothetical protein PLK08_08455 [Phycisphaerae bacterium]|nr:hypothetical protein [Phycisphaerae bacterium]